jgi:hypothetical protein
MPAYSGTQVDDAPTSYELVEHDGGHARGGHRGVAIAFIVFHAVLGLTLRLGLSVGPVILHDAIVS